MCYNLLCFPIFKYNEIQKYTYSQDYGGGLTTGQVWLEELTPSSGFGDSSRRFEFVWGRV